MSFITLYLLIFLQHFLSCQVSFFNTGNLIAEAAIRSRKGVRENSHVTWGNGNKASIQPGAHHCAKQVALPVGQRVPPKTVKHEFAARNICFTTQIQWARSVLIK